MKSVKNVTSYSKSFFCFFGSLYVIYYVCQVSSQSIEVLYPEKIMMGVISPPPPCLLLRSQNTSVGTGFIELTEPSDTLN